MKDIRRSLAFLKPYRGITIFAFFCAIAGSVMNVLIPRMITILADMITLGIKTQIDIPGILKIAVLALTAIIIGFLFSYCQSFILSGVSQKMTRDVRMELSDKVDRISIAYLDSKSSGDILSRTTNDVLVFSKGFTTNLGTIVENAVTLVGCVVMMLISSIPLAIIVIVTTIFGTMIASGVSKVSKPLFKKSRAQLGSLNAYIDEMFSGHLIIKSFNCEKEVIEEFDRQNSDLSESDWKSQFISRMLSPIMMLVGNLAYVLVCIGGAYMMIKHGSITVGTIAAFILYVKQFSSPISSIANVNSTLQPAIAAQGRIFELLDSDEMDMLPPSDIENVKGEVIFDHVKFGYLPDQIIIKDFSAKIDPGMKVAIVGPTGAGKTTLVNLLMRFYELNGGSIKLDGIPIDKMSRKDLHSIFGMVLQETWVFEGSIRDNIIYSTEGITEERFNEVLKQTGLDSLIASFPDGADTVISEKMELSTGQTQLITIARAMIKNPAVLILDEATSSIDTRTELIIQKAIDTLTQNRTSFVIAHRLSTIRNADVIFVMKDGNVVEVGKHEELLKQNGLYSEIYNSQFADEKMESEA